MSDEGEVPCARCEHPARFHSGVGNDRCTLECFCESFDPPRAAVQVERPDENLQRDASDGAAVPSDAEPDTRAPRLNGPSGSPTRPSSERVLEQVASVFAQADWMLPQRLSEARGLVRGYFDAAARLPERPDEDGMHLEIEDDLLRWLSAAPRRLIAALAARPAVSRPERPDEGGTFEERA